MKKYFAIISALVFVVTVSLLGCEKKEETPQPAAQPSITPVAPAPPAPAPAPEPAPAPAPAKHYKK